MEICSQVDCGKLWKFDSLSDFSFAVFDRTLDFGFERNREKPRKDSFTNSSSTQFTPGLLWYEVQQNFRFVIFFKISV